MLHAGWNLFLARAPNARAAAAATFTISIALAAPFAIVWWSARPSVWPYALASAVLEAVYIVVLVWAYGHTDLSFVYPLTRGVAPVLTLVAAIALLGHGASASEIGGVLLVAAGVVLVGPGGHAGARPVLAVTVISVCVAAYTLIDRAGIHRAGAFTYYVIVMTGPTVGYAGLVGWRKVRAELGRATFASGIANLASFVLLLLALRHGPAAPALAVRSSSIVFATYFARRILDEHITRERVIGSVVVFVGVALLAY